MESPTVRPLTRRRVEVGDHWLEVVEGGRVGAPSLLMLHGAAGSVENWRHQLRHLACDFHLVACNHRGHGRSPWPGPSGVDDFYADLEALVAALELSPRFVALGHSFGGYLAARLAFEQADRVAALGLFNTTGHLPRTPSVKFLELMSGRAGFFRRGFPHQISTGSEVSRQLMTSTLKQWNSWSYFSRLPMPALVGLGGRDLLIPVKLGRQMAELIPRVRLEVVPGAGHVLMMERPALVTRWIRELVQQATWSTGTAESSRLRSL